ncbi:hypothetical protein TNIN_391351 [Trichonephila inaurata madagascariensis]|uniref:Uncharacterized protein n=1 Tax=Trichonephila inaurata madagascariensis TaxID=2747483 RepID=A0A8X6WXT7_9ARAC|nr:hypothetical protein TNIN_391351 [Trichonephila inaurata madagascariensis]
MNQHGVKYGKKKNKDFDIDAVMYDADENEENDVETVNNGDEKYSPLRKIKQLVKQRNDVMMSLKFHKYTYCLDDSSRQDCSEDPDGSFENTLCSAFADNKNSFKEIQLFRFCFDASAPKLFETEEGCKIFVRDGGKSRS